MNRGAAVTLTLLLAAAPAGAQAPVFATITAVAESEAVEADPDDPAIWVNADDPAQSRIIGTDKQVGLVVFDLAGTAVQRLSDGRLNNIDLRQHVSLGGEELTLAAATRRDDDTIVFYTIDAEGTLAPAEPFAFPGAPREIGDDIYGLGLYHDARSGRLYVVVNFKTGDVFQWEVTSTDDRLALELRREWSVPSQPEGIVADDALGSIYVGEEDGGIWRFPADPEAEPIGTMIDAVGSACLPVDDVEGMAVGPSGGPEDGYLVVSAQGVNRYVLYPRRPDAEGRQPCLGGVEVGTGPTDPVSETDGLDVATGVVTQEFPRGVMVVQDDRNEGFSRNFKFVSWADVLEALGLD
jgi:3-phytase (myo-inositol-hexaphosphate 3-phosphohydrolase)